MRNAGEPWRGNVTLDTGSPSVSIMAQEAATLEANAGVTDADQARVLEEQSALIDVLAELFPGVMIARLALPSLEYSFANAAFCLRFGELKRRDTSAENKVIGRTLAEVPGLGLCPKLCSSVRI
jgi:hypothetical protein